MKNWQSAFEFYSLPLFRLQVAAVFPQNMIKNMICLLTCFLNQGNDVQYGTNTFWSTQSKCMYDCGWHTPYIDRCKDEQTEDKTDCMYTNVGVCILINKL